jgi:hypothetical protein
MKGCIFMAIDVRWFIPDRIVLHEFSGDITLEDATRASLEGPALANQGTPPVHMLVTLTAVTHYPRSVRQIEAAIRINPNVDRLGWVVILVKRNPVLRFVATILTQVRYSKMRFIIVEDMVDATRSFLAHDPSLAEFIAPDGTLISRPPTA